MFSPRLQRRKTSEAIEVYRAEVSAAVRPCQGLPTRPFGGGDRNAGRKASGALAEPLVSSMRFTAARFVDAAGAGDWCSAGFLHWVGQGGAAGLKSCGKGVIERALRTGQALSTLVAATRRAD
jgi:hypothetical protein